MSRLNSRLISATVSAMTCPADLARTPSILRFKVVTRPRSCRWVMIRRGLRAVVCGVVSGRSRSRSRWAPVSRRTRARWGRGVVWWAGGRAAGAAIVSRERLTIGPRKKKGVDIQVRDEIARGDEPSRRHTGHRRGR
jgi:hypothetical protein